MSSSYDGEFWTGEDRYNELAREYERHCEVTYPTKGSCPVCGSCFWGATNVTYYEYRGPNIGTLKD